MTPEELRLFVRQMRAELIAEMREVAAIADQSLQSYRNIFGALRDWKTNGGGPDRAGLIECAMVISAKAYQSTAATSERLDDLADLMARAQNLDAKL